MKDDASPQTMNCIVVGGVANGMYLRDIRANATFIRLGRPEHVRPLTSPQQKEISVKKEESVYEVHPIGLINSNEPGKTHLVGIAVDESKSLTWAFMQLVLSHIQKVTHELREEALKKSITH